MKYVISVIVAATLVIAALPLAALAQPPPAPTVSTLASGVQGASGSTIGPDGALYVTESQTGQILRIDTATGATSVFASGLPTAIAPIGGPMDIAFNNGTAYVLVSLVGEFFGSPDATGIYRMDGPREWTVIADLGTWAIANPPTGDLEYEITTGVHYAMENFRGGFAISDAHHNKALLVSVGGAISLLEEYGNTVPAGLETQGDRLLIAMSGPTPHLAQEGQVLAYPANGTSVPVAAGAPLLVDVELGPSSGLYGLAQGHFTPGRDPGAPADPYTGQLLLANGQGGFDVLVTGLNQPTSFEIVGTTAYVVGLNGDILRIDALGATSPGGEAGTSQTLAFTGAETGVLALIGAALLGAGALTTASARRLR